MLDRTAVLTVFRVYLAGVVIPGPDFVAVVHKAVAGTRSEALALVAGIVVVNLLWRAARSRDRVLCLQPSHGRH
jgi:threonine/homoserine/homoserine lactone efflux protein